MPMFGVFSVPSEDGDEDDVNEPDYPEGRMPMTVQETEGTPSPIAPWIFDELDQGRFFG